MKWKLLPVIAASLASAVVLAQGPDPHGNVFLGVISRKKRKLQPLALYTAQ
jgi:hypothetical protein